MASKSAAITLPAVLMPRIQLASTFEPSASGAPWVRSGTRFAIPPVPVVFGVPVPVRLNQVSIVNWPRSSLAGSPKVTYEALPSSRAMLPTADARRDDVRVGGPVVGVVGEAVGAVVAGGRGVGEAAVGVERQRRRGVTSRHEDRRQRIAFGIGVVGEDARGGHDLGRALRRRVRVGDGHRRVVGIEARDPGRSRCR